MNYNTWVSHSGIATLLLANLEVQSIFQQAQYILFTVNLLSGDQVNNISM